jgi:hypothetical protein
MRPRLAEINRPGVLVVDASRQDGIALAQLILDRWRGVR